MPTPDSTPNEATRRQWQAEARRAAGPYTHYLTAGRAFCRFVGKQTAVSPSFTIDTADVEAALENLWRLAQLAQNPLAHSPLVTRRLEQHNLPAAGPNQSKALHDALHEAIESLRHGRTPDQNNSQWRSWYILHHKYEKEQPNRQIYLRLNLSERTFYRERKAAIELAAGWALQHSCQTIAAETAASLDFSHVLP